MEATRVVETGLGHREQVLKAAREENGLLLANLERERQAAQRTKAMEAGRLANATKAAAEEARLAKAMAASRSGPPSPASWT
jgi:hypothetical protein